MVAQQVAGGEDEVVEIQQRRRALVLPEARHDRLNQGHEIGENMSGDGPVKRRPRPAAESIVGSGQIVQAIAIGFGQTRAFCRSAPLPLPLVCPKLAGLRAEFVVKRRDQQPDKRSRRFDRQNGVDLFGQVVEVARDDRSFRLLGVLTGQEIVEGFHRLSNLGRQLH